MRIRPSLAVLALLASAACKGTTPGPTTVPYPYNNNAGLDTTKPTLVLSTMTQTGNKSASVGAHVPGQPVTPVFAGTLDFANVSSDSSRTPDERALVVTYSATDKETGIQRIRLMGRLRVCEADGREADYQGSRTYESKDFTAGGATTVPVTASNTLNISIFELMHPLKDPNDRSKGRKDGTAGTFSFVLETRSGADVLINHSRAIVYTVGTEACPLP